MIAHGVVVDLDGPTATVEVCDKDVESCGSCAISCDPRKAGKVFQIEATAQMLMGSEVSLDVKMPSTYLAVTLLLLFPLAMLLTGIVIGQKLFGDELASFGLGIVLFAVAFGAARIFETLARRRGHYKPIVLSVHAPADAATD